jgi:hypothetical protein
MRHLPEAVLIEGALRAAFFRSFFGRMVSLLAFTRRVPAPASRPAPARSDGGPSAACGMEDTVSVSTVMFSRAGSTPDLDFSLPMDVFGASFAFGVESGSEAPFRDFERSAESLPLSSRRGKAMAEAFGVF